MAVIYHYPNTTPQDAFRRLLRQGNFTDGSLVTYYVNPLLPNDVFMVDRSTSLDVVQALGLRPVWSGTLDVIKRIK